MKFTNNPNFFENTERPIAFVFGNDAINILGAVRSFGKENIPTVVLSSKRSKQLFSFSKYCITIVCPDPKNNEKRYVSFLLNLAENLRFKGVLFPTSDIDLHVLLKHKDVLKQYFNFSVAELNVVEKLLDKSNFYSVLENEGIPHPRTFFTNNIDVLPEIVKKISFPCIIKPAHSGYFRAEFHKKFFIANSKEEVIKYYHKCTGKNLKMVIQEIIPGEATDMYGFNAYYDHNFKPHGVFMYNRIREWPVFAGNGCYIQGVRLPELEEIITTLMKKIKYYGIVDAEFKRDPRDGLFKLIEINPRIWLQNSFPTRCGCNLPHIAYMDTTEIKLEKVERIKDDIKWLDLYEDTLSAIRSITMGKLSFHELIKSYEGEKEHAIFSWDDPLPAFVSFVNFIFIEFPSILIGKIRNIFLKRVKRVV